MKPHRHDSDKCDLCRFCQEVCGRDIIHFENGNVCLETEGKCIGCGHCMAICPQGALVREDGSLPAGLEVHAMPSSGDLLHFLQSRRSTRRFKKEVPSRELLENLVEAARCAPTGTNKQDVRIVMVTDPERIEILRGRIMARYGEYEGHLNNRVKRFFLKTFVDKRLGDPAIREYLLRFMSSYREGKDPLFHRAPVIAFLYAGREASTPKDDCCIALYHMVLMAERLGLGSCLLGTAEAAFAKTPRLNDLLDIPREHKVQSSACFGFPAVEFKRLVDRKPPSVRWI